MAATPLSIQNSKNRSECEPGSCDPLVERVDPYSFSLSFRTFRLSEIYRTFESQGAKFTSPLPPLLAPGPEIVNWTRASSVVPFPMLIFCFVSFTIWLLKRFPNGAKTYTNVRPKSIENTRRTQNGNSSRKKQKNEVPQPQESCSRLGAVRILTKSTERE